MALRNNIGAERSYIVKTGGHTEATCTSMNDLDKTKRYTIYAHC